MATSLFGEAARALEAEGVRTRALGREIDASTAARVRWADAGEPWTIKDVLGHVAASHAGLLRALRGDAAPMPGRTLAEINEERRRERRDRPLDRVLEEIEVGRRAAVELLAALGDADWERVCRTSSGREWQMGRLAWIISTHEREHRARIEAALGRPTAAGGRVQWLNVSAGGVPKRPIFSARLDVEGLQGDAHRGSAHGGPERALCLFSQEVIDLLRGEGHPIEPGTIGENVTVSGLDWARVKPGDRLRIGPTLVEITRFTTPCLNIKDAFADGEFARVLATRHPGESRAYARVIETGELTVGDPVELMVDG
jgi:MOSC domain-containing protein YiiM